MAIRKKTWYRRLTTARMLASLYLRAYLRLPADSPYRQQAETYARFATIRLIFESNCIEQEGPPLAETKQIIEEHFPSLPASMAAYSGDPWREHLGLDDRRMRLMFEGVSEAYKRGLALAPGYTFGTKRKDVVLVAGHYMAYMTTKHHVSKWRLGYVARLIRKQWKTDPHWGGDWTEDLRNEVLQAAADAEPLLSTAVCRQIHADLADGQAEPSWGVEPGQYRKHAVSAGIDRVFLAASLVPQAMDRLEHDAISREPNRGLPTEDAATVTHRFLEIHPFPDFNGRTSRLLLSMWLQAKGIPFPISIRANNRWKARYGRSLRKADQGKPEEYSGLIDFAIIDGFRAIEMPVMALGCKSMFDHLVGGGPGHRRTEVEEVVAKATAALSEW